MDWSPDRVLNFGPVTHRWGLRWARRTNLLWPVYAWRVVTPVPHERPLNVLQRAVLRLQLTGTREHVKVAAFLGVEPELVAFVAEELKQMDLADASGTITDRGRRLLDESEFGVGDMRVGWVFQDTRNGRLVPRFVTTLEHADVEADDECRAWVLAGSKGSPRKDWAFVIRQGDAATIPPQPLEVLEAAVRHRRQERRLRRTGLDLEAIPAEAVQQVSLVANEPEPFHLLTFAYVPENIERENEPWYVADPFGFGASTGLREQLQALRDEAQGGLRDVLDRMTGEHDARQRDAWLAMQGIICEAARRDVSRLWPLSDAAQEDRVRGRIVLAFEELLRLEQEEEGGGREVRDRVDGAYLKLRQALEQVLQLLRDARPPRDGWRKLYQGERWLPKDAVQRVVLACATATGFKAPTSSALLTPNPGKVRAACARADTSSLRPLCVALVLAASDDASHPLRRLAAVAPNWLSELDAIAGAAGAEVHDAIGRRSLKDLRQDAEGVIRLCEQLVTVLVEHARDPSERGRT
jgi:hypothetical protein